MAASLEGYETWLTEKLLSVNPDADTDVFVSYITGILEEESPDAEKKESIVELLGQVVVRLKNFIQQLFRTIHLFGNGCCILVLC